MPGKNSFAGLPRFWLEGGTRVGLKNLWERSKARLLAPLKREWAESGCAEQRVDLSGDRKTLLERSGERVVTP